MLCFYLQSLKKRRHLHELLLGDVITESLGRILASTYNGNLNMLLEVIKNTDLNEFIRAGAFDTFQILQDCGIIEKEEICRILDDILSNELKNDDSYIITCIARYIQENKIYDKIGLIRSLYDDYRIEEFTIGGYDDFIDHIYANTENKEKQTMIEDTIDELSWWNCFEKDKTKKHIDYKEATKKFIENEESKIQKDIKQKLEIGRNDLCPCGSGKKYKKCCMNKQEMKTITPADIYIEKSLKKYPKENLRNFYNDEAIEIDQKIYAVLKHKSVPMWVDRNYTEETRRNIENMNEALELIKQKCEKDNIKTVEEYNRKIGIHYTLSDVIRKYFNLMDRKVNIYAKFLVELFEIFNDEELKKEAILNLMNNYDECYDIEEACEILIQGMPEMEKFILIQLAETYLSADQGISNVIRPINKAIEKFGKTEELEKEKIQLYYDYILDLMKYDEIDNNLFKKLWILFKDFIKEHNIKNEKEYDEKFLKRYSYKNIISEIRSCYEEYCEDIDEKNNFLEELKVVFD